MMHISNPQFVAACSNAGMLGILASAIYKSVDDLRVGIQEIKKLTKKPFSVNINLFPMLMNQRDLRKYVNAVIDEGVSIIETSGHKAPRKLVPVFKNSGCTWIHKCAGVRYAKTAERLGADMVEVVGWENGGATGKFDVGTMVLTPSTVDAINLPVIAGGGIVDGRSLVASLALGAVGAVMGTRLMMTEECPLHDNLKHEFAKMNELDTILIMRSVQATHRVWNNKAAQNVIRLENEKAVPQELFEAAAGTTAKKMFKEGDTDIGIVACGQGMGRITSIKPVAQVVKDIMSEAEEVIKQLTILRN
jgi:nitronate monooxygenase